MSSSDEEEEVIPCSLPPRRHDDRAITNSNESYPAPLLLTAGHDSTTYDDDDDEDGDVFHTSSQQTNRATNYSENEIFILARAWIRVSTDPATGTDQKSAAFWQRIAIVYGQFVATTNNKYSKTDGYTMLPEERSGKSVKSQWHNRLLPIASKFAGIIATNPPKSGEQYDDGDLTTYYAHLRNEVWPGWAGKLPRKIDQYMKAFHFLKDQPKFAQLQDPLSSDSEKKKAAAIKSIPRPIGRGSAKKMKAMETIVESLKDSMSTMTHPPTSLQTMKALDNLSSDIPELKEGLKKANDTMDGCR